MASLPSAGARFRAAMKAESPLHVVGAVNAFTAMLAQANQLPQSVLRLLQ